MRANGNDILERMYAMTGDAPIFSATYVMGRTDRYAKEDVRLGSFILPKACIPYPMGKSIL
jgi:hypothetical protein